MYTGVGFGRSAERSEAVGGGEFNLGHDESLSAIGSSSGTLETWKAAELTCTEVATKARARWLVVDEKGLDGLVEVDEGINFDGWTVCKFC